MRNGPSMSAYVWDIDAAKTAQTRLIVQVTRYGVPSDPRGVDPSLPNSCFYSFDSGEYLVRVPWNVYVYNEDSTSTCSKFVLDHAIASTSARTPLAAVVFAWLPFITSTRGIRSNASQSIWTDRWPARMRLRGRRLREIIQPLMTNIPLTVSLAFGKH
nr:hypothetical protein CFP56_03827 [Quercus suber]